MAVVWILAHFDDEYCALPLIRAWQAEGVDQRFLYLANYPQPTAERRLAETRALLSHLGLDPNSAVHVGADSEVMDGRVHEHLPTAFALLRDAVAGIGRVDRFVTPAWEGGHMDHDLCALMTVRLAATLSDPPRIDQFSLYTAGSRPGLGVRGAFPLPEGGDVKPVRQSLRQWLSWMTAVRFFPSQTVTWCGLWPLVFMTYARRGFAYQRLAPQRVEERPHDGELFYERRFKVSYETVRKAADAALPAPR